MVSNHKSRTGLDHSWAGSIPSKLTLSMVLWSKAACNNSASVSSLLRTLLRTSAIRAGVVRGTLAMISVNNRSPSSSSFFWWAASRTKARLRSLSLCSLAKLLLVRNIFGFSNFRIFKFFKILLFFKKKKKVKGQNCNFICGYSVPFLLHMVARRLHELVDWNWMTRPRNQYPIPSRLVMGMGSWSVHVTLPHRLQCDLWPFHNHHFG